MNNRVSVVSFRAIVPAPTTPGAPVEIKLKPICPAMVELQLFCTSTPVMATSGFRVLTRKAQIIPDTGSEESGITSTPHASDWAPLPAIAPISIDLYDKIVDGPAFEVTLQFYSTAALEVGGFLTTRDPQFGVHDLVTYMSSWMEKLAPRKD